MKVELFSVCMQHNSIFYQNEYCIYFQLSKDSNLRLLAKTWKKYIIWYLPKILNIFHIFWLFLTELRNKQNKDNINVNFLHINSLIDKQEYAIFWAFPYSHYLSITSKLVRFFQKFSFCIILAWILSLKVYF